MSVPSEAETVRVYLPRALQRLFEVDALECCDAGTVGSVIAALEGRHPGFRARVLEPTGSLRRYVNVFIDGEDARYCGGLDAAVRAGAEVRIVPAIAGGAASAVRA